MPLSSRASKLAPPLEPASSRGSAVWAPWSDIVQHEFIVLTGGLPHAVLVPWSHPGLTFKARLQLFLRMVRTDRPVCLTIGCWGTSCLRQQFDIATLRIII